jgi:hypothetical protein
MGFDYDAEFYHIFSRIKGMAPAEYRRTLSGRKVTVVLLSSFDTLVSIKYPFVAKSDIIYFPVKPEFNRNSVMRYLDLTSLFFRIFSDCLAYIFCGGVSEFR